MLAAALLGLLAWRDLTGARNDVLRARAQLVGVASAPGRMETPKGRASAVRAAAEAERHLRAASTRVRNSTALRIASVLPPVADQRAIARKLIDNALVATRAGRTLLGEVNRITDQVKVEAGAVTLGPLQELEGALRAAEARLAALPSVRGRPWGTLGDATDEFAAAISDSRGRLAHAADATGAARAFLGGNGRRRYFLAALNNAEMRDQGMVLSYAVLEVDGGRFHVTRQGSTVELALKTPAPVDVPESTKQIFGPIGVTQAWQNVNATADFGFSGRAMVAMYKHATGEHVDGVIALDVPAMANVLRVVGPVTVPGLPAPLTARTAAKVLLHDLYQALPARADLDERREILDDVMATTVERMARGGYDALRLARQIGRSARGLHLRVHSSEPAIEKVFVRSGLGGGPASEAPHRTIHFAVQNFTATKLDYFVRPRAEVDVFLTEGGDAIVEARIVVPNEAPQGAPPSYQLGPDGVNSKSPGDYVAQVYMWGPRTALSGASIESGLAIDSRAIFVRPGDQSTATFRLDVADAVRDGRLMLRFVPQPRLFPVPVEVTLQAPDWKVSGADRVTLAGDAVATAEWPVRRR